MAARNSECSSPPHGAATTTGACRSAAPLPSPSRWPAVPHARPAHSKPLISLHPVTHSHRPAHNRCTRTDWPPLPSVTPRLVGSPIRSPLTHLNRLRQNGAAAGDGGAPGGHEWHDRAATQPAPARPPRVGRGHCQEPPARRCHPPPSCPSLGSGNGRAEASPGAAGPPALARLVGRGVIARARAWGEATPYLAAWRAPPAPHGVPVVPGERHRAALHRRPPGEAGQGGSRRALQSPAGVRRSQPRGQRTRLQITAVYWASQREIQTVTTSFKCIIQVPRVKRKAHAKPPLKIRTGHLRKT